MALIGQLLGIVRSVNPASVSIHKKSRIESRVPFSQIFAYEDGNSPMTQKSISCTEVDQHQNQCPHLLQPSMLTRCTLCFVILRRMNSFPRFTWPTIRLMMQLAVSCGRAQLSILHIKHAHWCANVQRECLEWRCFATLQVCHL